MLVALYVGGKLQKGEDGVCYTKDAAFGFHVDENTTFQELKQLIYEKTSVNPNRYEIEHINYNNNYNILYYYYNNYLIY